MKEQFYEKALPTQGVYCATAIKNGAVSNRFAESLPELFSIINDLREANWNVFVAMSTFGGHSRRTENARFARSFFLDLDVGPDPRKYPDKSAAQSALSAFVQNEGLPPPVVVDSGTGIHAYWLFNEDVPTPVWRVYAEKFKQFCLSKLLIDPVVTADAARIMRCPETQNHKTEPPTPTRFITTKFWTYDFDAFTEFLGIEEFHADTVELFNTIQKGSIEGIDIATDDDPYEADFDELAQKSVDDEGGCQQLKYMLMNAETLQEPQWRAELSIVRYCLNWETNIHEVSKPYPNYTPQETEAKAAALINEHGRVKVYTCATIENLNPGGCDGCAFRGKISNPTHIVRRLKTPTSAPANAVRIDEDPESVPTYTTFPEDLAPFKRGPQGGIWYKPPAKKDKDGNWIPQRDVELWKYDVYPIKRMYDPDEGECFLMRHIMPHDDTRDFLLPAKSVYSTDKFREACVGHGMWFNPDNTQLLIKYVVKWGEVLVNFKQAEQTRRQMGWTDDNNSFVIGDREYRRDGKVRKTAANSFVSQVAALMTQKGTYEKWQEAAAKLNRPGYEMHAFVMMCGLGSPLMRFTPVKGVTIGLIGRTGAAKSGALYAAASMFGEPYGLCLSNAEEGATKNALIQWMMGLKNVMFGLDEATNYEPQDVSRILYSNSTGKNKLRMSASNNSIRPIEMSSALISILTANESMIDKLLQEKGSPDGELARYAELQIEKPPTMTDAEGTDIFQAFRHNYGWAGPKYVQHLFTLSDEYITGKLNKWGTRFAEAVGGSTKYRFFTALISTTFGGAEIAMEAGIIDLDLEKIYRAVVNRIIAANEKIVGEINYETALGEFQRESIGGTIVVRDGAVVREPKTKLVARMDLDDKLYYVSSSELSTFLARYKLNRKEFVFNMKEKGILTFDRKKQLAAGWGGFSNTANVMALGFKNMIPEDLDV